MKYATDVTKLLNWFATKETHNSEFRCAVCDQIFYRDIAEEFDNLTFNTGKTPIATGSINQIEVGLIWTCSDRCRVTYTLQRV
jgi:hypothetical protein